MKKKEKEGRGRKRRKIKEEEIEKEEEEGKEEDRKLGWGMEGAWLGEELEGKIWCMTFSNN